LIAQLNQLFASTWIRHGSGSRPDVPTPSLDVWPLNGVAAVILNSNRSVTTSKREAENPKLHVNENNLAEIGHSYPDPSSQAFHKSDLHKNPPRTIYPSVSHAQHNFFYVAQGNIKLSEQLERNNSARLMQGERDSPELTDTSVEGFCGRRTRVVDMDKSLIIGYSSRRNILVPEVADNHNSKSLGESMSSLNSSSLSSAKAPLDSNSVAGSYHEDTAFVMNEEISSASESSEMHHDEQVLVNLMASAKLHGLNGQVQLPMQIPSHLSVAHSRTSQVPNDFHPSQMGVPNPMFAPFLIGSQQRQSDSFGLTFIPTGQRPANIIGQTFGTLNEVHQPDTSASSTASCSTTPESPSDEQEPDILNNDLIGHWHNLQYGRFCQNAPPMGPVLYPFMVPPMYLQGHAPWDGSGRPVAPNANWTQMVGPGQRVFPVVPVHPTTERPTDILQHYGEDAPRYRGGTGTYLPNPVRS
jgi:hypothetical protein